MTTIAFDGRFLAADTQTCQGDARRKGRKIYLIEDQYAIATCGETQKSLLFVEWAKRGFKDEERPSIKEPFAAIVVNLLTGKVAEYEDLCVAEPFTEKYCANGSGKDIAIAAMELGHDAIAGVKLACKINLYTGLPVEYIDIARPQKGIQVDG
jgi:hypothetical protein